MSKKGVVYFQSKINYLIEFNMKNNNKYHLNQHGYTPFSVSTLR